MFVPDGLRTNAYRILRLSANATLSEIHKAAASMKRAAKLGLAGTNETDIPLLDELPRSEADIQGAMGRLANPSQRLNDRLFWFYELHHPRTADVPACATEAISGPKERAIQRHDEALYRLFLAFNGGLDDSGIALWVQALREWHAVVSEDDYWTLVLDLEDQGGFEPVALPSDVDVLRDDAVRLAADGLIVAGRDALARRDIAILRRIFAALKELVDTGPWAVAAQEDIASPAVERFRELCRAALKECTSKIARKQDAGEQNKIVCDAALRRFRSEIEPALHEVIQILSPDHEAAQQLREEAALFLGSIASGYTWADDFITSEELYEEALRLAQDTLGAIRIEQGLAQIRNSARQQRVFGALQPISSAPSLSTINGFGFKLYGASDYDPETQSYATTHYFVALFIPIFPVGRYRVINDGGNRYRFLGKLPLRKEDRWHLGIAAVAMVAMILIIGINSSQSSGTVYKPSTGSPISTNQRSYGDSQTSKLPDLKARIEAGRSRISRLESQLQPVVDELTTLKSRIEDLGSDLKSLKDQNDDGIPIDVDDYNNKVNTYNELLNRHRALVAANASDVQRYKELLEEDKALVAQYNARLR